MPSLLDVSRPLAALASASPIASQAWTHLRGDGGGGGMLRIQTTVIQFAASLQPQLAAIERRDAKLAEQLRRALLSVGLNLGEGYGASGGMKRRAYRIARGEASELEMGLEMAVALGYCRLGEGQRDDMQRILGTLQKLTMTRG